MLQRARSVQMGGYISLIGGISIQLAYGCLYTYGNLVPYFASYLTYAQYHQQSQVKSMAEMISIYQDQIMKFNIIFSLRFIAFAIGLYYSGQLEESLGPKKTLFIASVLTSAGFGLTFFALKSGDSSFFLCYITLGLIWTAGMGISLPILMIVGMRWFPERTGFVGGFSTGLFGLGAFIFDFLESYFVNPLNVKFDVDIGYVKQPAIIARIPMMCVYIALIMVGMQVISIFCVKNPPWFKNGPRVCIKCASKKLLYEKYSLTVKEAMKFSSLWILFAQTFLYVIVSNVPLLQWKLFAVNDLLILNDKFLSIVGSVSALFYSCGRIFWGWFHDYTGHSYRFTQSSMSIVISFFIITWPLCAYSPMIMFPIWNIIIWFHVNSCFAIYPSVISTTFGAKYVGSYFGYLAIAEMFSATFVALFSPYIYVWFGGWVNYLLMIGALGFSTVLLSTVYNPKIDRKEYLYDKRLLLPNSDSSIATYSTFDS